MDRISTGNVGADRILQGGFPARSINIIMGAPGTGKTLFAEQMAFANLGDRPVLYLTTVSEPLSKVITYLQQYSFADPDQIGSRIIYESLGQNLTARPESLQETVTELLKLHRPSLIIIDSFKAVADLLPDRVAWRRTLYELAGLLSAYDATCFWIGEYATGTISEAPEFAVADGILELSRTQTGSRDERFLRIVKLRGSGFLEGSHFFRITRSGLDVFVRLVAPDAPPDQQVVAERLASGIAGLDRMIETGWLRGTSTIVAGPAGSGKTSIGLHFLREGVARDEPGLLVNFQETPTQLQRGLASFGWQPDALLGPGRLDVLYTSPVELQLDSIVTEMFRRVEANRVRRVVIDSLGDLAQSANDPLRFRDYMYALTQYLVSRGVTAMILMETPGIYAEQRAAFGVEVSQLSDNVLLLGMELEHDLRRTVRIIKSRGSAHEGRRLDLTISARGVAIGSAGRGA